MENLTNDEASKSVKNETLVQENQAIIRAYMSQLGKKSAVKRKADGTSSQQARDAVNARWKRYRDSHK